jgi:hypothetical protein
MKDMSNTDKAEERGKVTRMRGPMMEAMTTGTLKETSGKIGKILRRESGTRNRIHSKDGHHRRLLP